MCPARRQPREGSAKPRARFFARSANSAAAPPDRPRETSLTAPRPGPTLTAGKRGTMARPDRLDGFSSEAEYNHYAAQYWAMRCKHDGYTEPLRTSQHILHPLLTVFTGGLWSIGWFIC